MEGVCECVVKIKTKLKQKLENNTLHPLARTMVVECGGEVSDLTEDMLVWCM